MRSEASRHRGGSMNVIIEKFPFLDNRCSIWKLIVYKCLICAKNIING